MTSIQSVSLPSGETVPVLGQGTWFMGEKPKSRADELAALLLAFGPHRKWRDDKDETSKTDYIYSGSTEERTYLKRVFAGEETDHRFSASDGFYELYVPVKTQGGTIVMYFTDRQRYGKYGS